MVQIDRQIDTKKITPEQWQQIRQNPGKKLKDILAPGTITSSHHTDIRPIPPEAITYIK